MSGTSFSTPIAAGIAALFLDFCRPHKICLRDEGVTTNLQKIFLHISSVSLNDDYRYLAPWNLVEGLGRENLNITITEILRRSPGFLGYRYTCANFLEDGQLIAKRTEIKVDEIQRSLDSTMIQNANKRTQKGESRDKHTNCAARTKTWKEFLEWLYPEDTSIGHKRTEKKLLNYSMLTSTTGRWFLTSRTFQDWNLGISSPLLVCEGNRTFLLQRSTNK